MISSVSHVIENFMNKRDYFVGGATMNDTMSRSVSLIAFVLAVVLVYAIVFLFGKFLWNNFLVKYVSVVKPVDSWIDLVAISILGRLMFTA
jgi:hypothetical protein